MEATAYTRDLIWKLQVARRQMVTAFNLTLGSFITQHWVSTSDQNVTNVDGETLDGVLKLYNENFTETNEKRFTNYTRFFKRTTYVYTHNNEVKGYCLYYIKPSLSSSGLKRTATLYSFTVDKGCRGRGIGLKLLQKSILEMKLNSINSIMLYVATDNEPALNLYKKVGFQITEELMHVCGPGKKCYKMEISFEDISLEWRPIASPHSDFNLS